MTVRVGDNVVVHQNMISRHRPAYAVGQNILVKKEKGGTWHTVGIISGRRNENVICYKVNDEWIGILSLVPPPILEYLFNEGSGNILFDTSEFKHNAEIRGSGWSWQHDATHGWTVFLDGTINGIFVGNPPHLAQHNRSYTLEIIAKFTTTEGGALAARGRWFPGVNEFRMLGIEPSPGLGTDLVIRLGGRELRVRYDYVNRWLTHRLTVNWATHIFTYYVNGVQLGTSSFSTTRPDVDLTFGTVGFFDNFASMIGNIAQIRMWDGVIIP